MKKIITVLMVLMVATSMFAYIPNKACVKAKGNKIKYYDKTELWSISGIYEPSRSSDDGRECVEWVIDKDMTVEKSIDINYEFLEKYRKIYKENIEESEEELKNAKAWINYIKQPGLKGADSLERYNYLNENILTEEEYHLYEKVGYAHYRMSWMFQYKHRAFNSKKSALISIPFTTEENWLTITKEEMLTKMKAFIEDVKQNK